MRGTAGEKRCEQIEVEHPSEAVERLFGEKLHGAMDFQVRDLLAVLWPLGPEAARRRAH